MSTSCICSVIQSINSSSINLIRGHVHFHLYNFYASFKRFLRDGKLACIISNREISNAKGVEAEIGDYSNQYSSEACTPQVFHLFQF